MDGWTIDGHAEYEGHVEQWKEHPEVVVALFLLGQMDWKAILTGRSSRPTGQTALQSPSRWTDFWSGQVSR